MYVIMVVTDRFVFLRSKVNFSLSPSTHSDLTSVNIELNTSSNVLKTYYIY